MSKTSAKQWAKRIERWQLSGLKAKAFGQRHGIDPKQLSWWKWHLKKRGELSEESSAEVSAEAELDSTAIRLLPVRVVDDAGHEVESSGRATVEIGLRNGRVVRVTQGSDLGWLAELLSVVEWDGDAPC